MNKNLTEFLREIGEEKTSVRIDGKLYKCTRTEATARKMFLLAQGGTEEIVDKDNNKVIVVHKADPRVTKMVREFTEGKAAQEPAPEKKPRAKAGRYDSEIGRRLNERLGPKPVRPQRPMVGKGKTG